MSGGGRFWNPAPKERPLRPELPVPPYVMIGDVECVLRYVSLDALPDWRKRNNLERIGTAFMGRLGYVNIYWPINEKGDEPCDEVK